MKLVGPRAECLEEFGGFGVLRMDAERFGGVSARGGLIACAEEFFGKFGVGIGIGGIDAERGLEGADGGGGVGQSAKCS